MKAFVVSLLNIMSSPIDRLFIATNKSAFILRQSVGLHREEPRPADLPIIEVLHSRACVVAHEHILLIISTAEQIKQPWVFSIANRLQYHVVPFLNSNESNIFHSLNERQGATVGLACFLVQVLIERVLVVEIVSGPELHGETPCDQIFRETTPYERAVCEQPRSSLFVEVAVPEHGRVGVEVTDTCSPSHLKLLTSPS